MKHKGMMMAVAVVCGVQTLCAATNYVSLTGSSTPPYGSWADAATNIQTAVDAAVDGDLVLVQAGTYMNPHSIPEEWSGSILSITNGVTVRATGATPQATAIDGGGRHARCVYLGHPQAAIENFTIMQGRARLNVGPTACFPTNSGGGIFFDGGGTAKNCILYYSAADGVNGGMGGNVYMNGGGLLQNCLIREGGAPFGGGVYCANGGAIESCTIMANTTSGTNLAGGVWLINGGTIDNTIIWTNTTADIHIEGSVSNVTYSCTVPGIPGAGNVSIEPLFAQDGLGNWPLGAGSPCDGAGTNVAWMVGATDIVGNPRIAKGTVDMGAYETPGIYYVAPNGTHMSPFSTWATAATNIESAMQLASAYPDVLVLVSNGVYLPAMNIDLRTNLTVRSLNGPAATTILGGPGRRCAAVSRAGAVLDGFTLTGGALTNNGDQGAGVKMNAGTVRNCIVRNNSTQLGLGGGIQMNAGLVENTTISENYSGSSGGGGVIAVGACTLRNCVVANNATRGAGASGSLGGGGILLVNGVALDNCTIVRNTSGTHGGGVNHFLMGPPTTATVRNTIIQHNIAASDGQNYTGATLRFEYSCTEPAVSAGMDGGGNIALDPRLAALVPGVYRLGWLSPCLDAGSNMAWMAGAKDVMGMPRLAMGAVDMGAYEVPAVYYVATNGAHVAPFADWDNAATNIVAAVAVATTGSLVAVDGGIYRSGVEILVQKPIAVQGVDGWPSTIVDGLGAGGRFRIRHAEAVVDGLTVTNCSSPMGGGVVLDPGTIQNCLMTGNGAGQLGGGMQVNGGMAYRCRISGNVGSVGGGVMLLGGAGKLWNCQIDRNAQTGSFSGISGGAGVISVGGGEVANCTIAANSSSNSGGGIMHMGFGPFTGPLSVVNSIVSGNTAGDGSSNYYHVAYNALWKNSCTDPVFPTNVLDGGNNVFTDPIMADPSSGNYRIIAGSPCENTGTNLAWSAFATDLDGEPRTKGGTVDMGAYEAIDVPVVNVTSVNATVTYDTTTCTVGGSNNAVVVGDLTWTNNLNEASGSVPVSGYSFEIPGIPLAVGGNTISVRGRSAEGLVSGTSVTITRGGTGTGAPFVDITNTDETVSYDVTGCMIGGTNNMHVAGTMWWTNSLTGGSGVFPAAADWSQGVIGLAVGANIITVYGTNLWNQQTSDSVTITRGGAGTGVPFVDITNADETVSYDVAVGMIGGTNNAHVAGTMWWTNSLTGGNGVLTAAAAWTIGGISLAEGANVITVYGTNLWNQQANDSVTITRGGIGTGAPYVDVTNADETVSYDVTGCTIGGTNNAQVAGGMWWTNSLTGGIGIFPASAGWTIATIGLAEGVNVITVYGTNLWNRQTSDSVTITRGGTGTGAPFIDCDVTNDPLVVYDAPTNIVLTGTNNLQVVGNMWLVNLTTTQQVVFAAAQSWTSLAVQIEMYTNIVQIYGTNMYGVATNDVVTIIGVPEPAAAAAAALFVIGYSLVVTRRRRK